MTLFDRSLRDYITNGVTTILQTLETLSHQWMRRMVKFGLPCILAGYGLAFRALGIENHFWFMGDQQRDWLVVQGSFTELPTVGPPTVTGGVSWGPIFYWVLWLIKQFLAPILGNAPHVGAIGLLMLRAASDALLTAALLRRGLPVMTVAGIGLLIVSSPFDGALAATIWNPGLAVALVNVAIASVLWSHPRPLTLQSVIFITTTCWLAVQSHTPAIFAAVPMLLYLPWTAGFRDQAHRRAASRTVLAMAITIITLQLPYAMTDRDARGSSNIIGLVGGGINQLLDAPLATLIGDSGRFLVNGLERMFVTPAQLPLLWLWFLIGLIITTAAWRQSFQFLVVSVVPVACAWAGYSVLNLRLDTYWLLSMSAPLALAVFGGVGRIAPRPLAGLLTAGLLLTVTTAQPDRWREFNSLFKAPQYGAIVKTLRGLVNNDHQTADVLGADTDARAVNPALLFHLLGGTFAAEGNVVTITRTGELIFDETRP